MDYAKEVERLSREAELKARIRREPDADESDELLSPKPSAATTAKRGDRPAPGAAIPDELQADATSKPAERPKRQQGKANTKAQSTLGQGLRLVWVALLAIVGSAFLIAGLNSLLTMDRASVQAPLALGMKLGFTWFGGALLLAALIAIAETDHQLQRVVKRIQIIWAQLAFLALAVVVILAFVS